MKEKLTNLSSITLRVTQTLIGVKRGENPINNACIQPKSQDLANLKETLQNS